MNDQRRYGGGDECHGNAGALDQQTQCNEEACEREHAVQQSAQDVRRRSGTLMLMREDGQDGDVERDGGQQPRQA